MSYQEASLLEPKAQRRPSKYTPERIQQIKDLLARGESCEQIAAIIGVTVGSLRVTCSKLGVSLRRPRVKLLPPRTADAAGEAATPSIIMKYKGQERGIYCRLHQTSSGNWLSRRPCEIKKSANSRKTFSHQ